MGWQPAIVGAIGVAQYHHKTSICNWKFNQDVQNRNAAVLEQESKQIEKKLN